MSISIRRCYPGHEIVTLALLGGSVLCLGNGLGSVIRGAAFSVFLPVGLLAALLGWGLGKSRLHGWLVAGSLAILGGSLHWAGTAQLGGVVLEAATSSSIFGLAYLAHLHGGPLPNPAPVLAALERLAAQSGTLWNRLLAWSAGLWGNTPVEDAVVRVMLWSIAIWLMCAWAGFALQRCNAFIALAPALVSLAFVTDYTGREINSLWLLMVLMLALVGLGSYSANLKRWATRRLDFAEIITSNTLVTLTVLTTLLAATAWLLPSLPFKQLYDEWRHPATHSRAPQALGLAAAPPPITPIPRAPAWPAELTSTHPIGAGPSRSPATVFSVRTGELPPLAPSNNLPPLPNHHWRSQTFDIYTGRGWSTSATTPQTLPPGQLLFTSPPQNSQLLEQTVQLAQPDGGKLVWSGTLYQTDQPLQAAWRRLPATTPADTTLPFNGGDLFGALLNSPTYHAQSYLPNPSLTQLREAGTLYPEFIRTRYLQLPETISERTYVLARTLTATSATPYDQALAIETYLRNNFPYTADLPAPPRGVEITDYFLFDLQKGYCDYYATSMAVLARAVGLPARLVTGYASGQYDPQRAEYNVRALDAHAWVEIYFPGIGWVEFEPTANQPSLRREINPIPTLLPVARTPRLPLLSGLRLSTLTRLVLCLTAGFFLLAGIILILEDFLLRRAAPARALRWIFHRIYQLGSRLTETATPGTTAEEYSSTLQAHLHEPQPLRLLTEIYQQALFSREPVSRQKMRQAVQAWRKLRWKLLLTRKKSANPTE